MDRNAISAVLELMPLTVALRKESVDRNAGVLFLIDEIQLVALRKESVDRNMPNNGTFRSTHSRSP